MNREEQRFQAAVAAMQGQLSNAEWMKHLAGRCKEEEAVTGRIVGHALNFADALLTELDRTKPEPEFLQPEGFPDFQKWTAYEGLGTIKEGDEDIFAHRNLSSLTERHNRAIAAFREWACRQAKAPQPDADGWIPHRPGDPAPCKDETKVFVKYADGYYSNHIHSRKSTWELFNRPTLDVIAWKPA